MATATPLSGLPAIGELEDARRLFGEQAGMSRDMWNMWRQQGLPAINRLQTDIDAMASPAAMAQAEGRAASTVAGQYDTARQGYMNQMARYGITPGSGRFSAGLRELALGRAADQAGAMNQARMGLRDRALGARSDMARFWGALPGQAMGGLARSAQGMGALGSTQLGREGNWLNYHANLKSSRARRRSGLFAALGNVLGGAIGIAPWLFSDRLLKRGIRPVAELDCGLTVYEHSYVDDPDGTLYAGLMADEVRERFPECVAMRDGYYAVDYEGVIGHELRAGRTA